MTSAMSTLRSNQSELTALVRQYYTTNFVIGKCACSSIQGVCKVA